MASEKEISVVLTQEQWETITYELSERLHKIGKFTRYGYEQKKPHKKYIQREKRYKALLESIEEQVEEAS